MDILTTIGAASSLMQSLFGKKVTTTQLGWIADYDIFDGKRRVIGISELKILQNQYVTNSVIYKRVTFSKNCDNIMIISRHELNGGSIKFSVQVPSGWKEIGVLEETDAVFKYNLVKVYNNPVLIKIEMTRGSESSSSPVIEYIKVLGINI